jgi:hypothetical protein
MATQIFLGNPPENIKQFIIDNYGPKEDPMLKTPLHFVAEDAGATIKLDAEESPDGICTFETSPTGEEGSWTPYTSYSTITLTNVGDKIYFRAGENGINANGLGYTVKFIIKNGKIAANGNITSLIDKTMLRLDAPQRCFDELFKDCTALTKAPLLPATTLNTACYNSMFSGCTSLIQSPELPATEFTYDNNSIYTNMFYGCTSLAEPKYKLINVTANYVSGHMYYIFGDNPIDDSFEIQCSDKILIATFDTNNWQWNTTEKQ